MEILSNKKDEGVASPSFVITDIKQAVRAENRVNIFINDKFDFSLDIAQVVDLKLKKGQVLTEKELKDCRHASEFGKLYQRTLEYVLSRPHSIKETRDHLVQNRKKRELTNLQAARNRERIKNETKEERASRKALAEKFGTRLKTKELPLFTDDDIEKVIARLIAKGYLDDEKFVRFYTENKNVKKGISLKKIRQDLVQKGVSQNLIEQILAESPRDESEEIKKIIMRKRKKYDDEKLIMYLVRQGFDYQQSKDLVRETGSQN